MRNNSLKVFPGANTPRGFFSYYDSWIDEKNLNKVFYIKGGSGLGKSTLIKTLGNIYEKNGDTVYFKCSSDPESLDGVLFEDKRIAIIDGTFPHISEPSFPGISGEIINLAEYLEEDYLESEKNNLIILRHMKEDAYKFAYKYLKLASEYYSITNELYKTESIKTEIMNTMETIKNRIDKTSNKKSHKVPRKIRKAFISGITADGVVNELDSIINNVEEIYTIDNRTGIDISNELFSLAEWIVSKGNDVCMFYCTINPDKCVEHILSHDLGVVITTQNKYHSANEVNNCKSESIFSIGENLLYNKEYCELINCSNNMILKAVAKLSEAKNAHDEIEKIYGKAMDYSQATNIKNNLIEKIDYIV